jgi:predicted RNase H-like HicB family nuclease
VDDIGMAAKKLHYPAVIDKDADSDFGVAFSDFPGCVSAGTTLDEAVLGAHEALAGHVAAMVADADPLPEPTPLETVAANRDASTVAITLVSVSLPGKMQRVNITMDAGLLDETDAVADNRSRFLADAARAERTAMSQLTRNFAPRCHCHPLSLGASPSARSGSVVFDFTTRPLGHVLLANAMSASLNPQIVTSLNPQETVFFLRSQNEMLCWEGRSTSLSP